MMYIHLAYFIFYLSIFVFKYHEHVLTTSMSFESIASRYILRLSVRFGVFLRCYSWLYILYLKYTKEMYDSLVPGDRTRVYKFSQNIRLPTESARASENAKRP